MATATTEAVRLPPVLRAPKALQGLAFLLARRSVVAALGRRHGNVFTLDLPGFGRTVVVGDPDQIQDLFGTSRELLCRSKLNLGRIFGPGSMFNLSGDEHLRRRRLLSPPFHSVHVARYRDIVTEEFLRESSDWPEGREFETMPWRSEPASACCHRSCGRTSAHGARVRICCGTATNSTPLSTR
jgi:cytochrome P450